MVRLVQGERLLERKQMLGAVAAGERLCDRLGAGVATVMAQARQRVRVALAGKDGADDAQAGGTSDVGDDVVELNIHLCQRLLHVLDVRSCVFQKTLALTHVGSQLRNLSFGPKTGPQQSKRMEPLQPLRIADIGFAPRHVLGIARIDKTHSKPACIEKLEDRNPVDAGRLHDDGLDTAFCKPVDQRMQIGRKGAEAADWLRCAISADGRHVHCRPDVNGSRVRVHDRHLTAIP